ncbi:citrate lyase subunit beta [Brucella vulpis]|uniref:HpcH/HpaI aldolase/citrate lyase family protein n=1 Tax=Brucella vulpis TaxID=981386 RepID=UPI00073AC164|nr:putative citrate lyase subunit beta [Brucella vulpis]CUW51420.1 citrate lyase subunit beta [Brucella vulpis]
MALNKMSVVPPPVSFQTISGLGPQLFSVLALWGGSVYKSGMKTIVRPRRSVLFVPAANTRALEKSLTLSADCVIYDLEDSVAPEAKAAARSALVAHLSAHPKVAFERIVRVNAAETLWGRDDVAAVAKMAVNAVLLPKVERPQDVIEAANHLDRQDADPAMGVWAMIETLRGILNVDEIAVLGHRSAVRLACFVVGPNDIARETGLRPQPGRPYLVPWLMQIVLAARAGGIAVLDGVYNDFRDSAGFEAECAQGAAMGFDGKTLIHPAQIEAANRAFSPTEEEVAHARAVREIFARPENAGKGVVSLDGQMVERLHLEMAERILAKAGINL